MSCTLFVGSIYDILSSYSRLQDHELHITKHTPTLYIMSSEYSNTNPVDSTEDPNTQSLLSLTVVTSVIPSFNCYTNLV